MYGGEKSMSVVFFFLIRTFSVFFYRKSVKMLQRTSVTSVVEDSNGKETWLNTKDFILEKNFSFVQSVEKSLQLVKHFCTTSLFILGRSLFNVLFAGTSKDHFELFFSWNRNVKITNPINSTVFSRIFQLFGIFTT